MQVETQTEVDLLDDLSDAVDYAIVGPRDSRVHEINTARFPWNTICHLGRDFGDGRWRGCTGALIGPRLVLTAGHCLYNHRFRRTPQRIRVIPGRADRDRFPYGTLITTEYFAPQRYIDARFPNIIDRQNFDYGVVILPQQFQRISRFMTIRVLNDEELVRLKRSKLFTIAGYPGDRPIGTMWRHTERLRQIMPQRLHYTMDTCPGHSGSPVSYIRLSDREHVIVGIHTSGIIDERGRSYGCSPGTILAPPGLMNSGVRITQDVFENISDPYRRVGGVAPMVKLP
jgi:V8-like Glu-specific endopeptidase